MNLAHYYIPFEDTVAYWQHKL